MITTFQSQRALLLASVCFVALATNPAWAASVTVANGQTHTTLDQLSGTDAVVVNSGGILQAPTNSSNILQWFGPATGAGISITNNGSILGHAATNNVGLISGNGANSTGTLTITKTGLISNQGTDIGLNSNVPATANLVVINSGTITNVTGTITSSARNIHTGNTDSLTVSGELGNTISETQANSAANITITNTGTINGTIGLGIGVNVVNITTGSVLSGGINAVTAGNNTVNLSGTGSGFAFGASENATNPVSSTYAAVILPKTLYGWDNIQTLNVNSGTWSLLGQGLYNNLNIASGAAFNVCTDGPNTACGSSYNGSNSPNVTISSTAIGTVAYGGSGAVTAGGIGSLNQVNGTLAIANNGTLTNFFNSNDTAISYDPVSAPQGVSNCPEPAPMS